MDRFTPTPEQLEQIRSGVRLIETTPEQEEYLRRAQEEEDAAFAADAGWTDAARMASMRRRLMQLEETVNHLAAEVAELRGAK